MINQIIIDNCLNRLADGECDRLEFYYKGKKQTEFRTRRLGLAFLPPITANGTWVIHGNAWDLRTYDYGSQVVPFDEIREKMPIEEAIKYIFLAIHLALITLANWNIERLNEIIEEKEKTKNEQKENHRSPKL